jgi:hypothetical protein
MSTTTRQAGAAGSTTAGRSVLVTAIRVLLALFAVVKLAATAYFTFFASAEAGGVQSVGDWLVAAWSALVAAGYLVVAARLGRHGRGLLPLAAGLFAADVAFGLVKLVAYDETESVGITALTLLLFALVVAATRARKA